LGPKHDQHSLGQLSRVIYRQKQIQSNGESKGDTPSDSHDEQQQRSSWRDEYKENIKKKFLSQLNVLALQQKEKVTVSIHFGTFYAVNAGECFGSLDITLDDLTKAHLRGRELKDREHYDEIILPMSSNDLTQPKTSGDNDEFRSYSSPNLIVRFLVWLCFK
jgi:hypothetical protein